jgi:hypothetical protein
MCQYIEHLFTYPTVYGLCLPRPIPTFNSYFPFPSLSSIFCIISLTFILEYDWS